MNPFLHPYQTLGRSHVTLVVCVVLATVAFFKFHDSPGLTIYIGFLTAVGGLQNWRSVNEDRHTGGNVGPDTDKHE